MDSSRGVKNDQVEWGTFLSQLESFIVLGQHEKCRELLMNKNPKKIPRPWASRFADIAWRANSYLFALKTLQPIIYPENSIFVPATPQEKVIYGSSLSSLGATHEAIKILEAIDREEEPSALFHLASALMHEWNYEAAIPYLQKYVYSSKVTPYRQLVGKVNWAASLIHIQDWKPAKKLLAEIQCECEINLYQLLLGNCLELKAQIEIFQGHFGTAREFLGQALLYLKDQSGHYSMYVDKWLAICDCLQSKNEIERSQHLLTLSKVRQQAIGLKHWNTIRECDLFESISNGDRDLFKKVIMGTPSELYRQRARKMFGGQAISKGKFHRFLGPAGGLSGGQRGFDPYQRTSIGEALFKKPFLFSLFQALTCDFYQPQTLAMLFQKIYPSENFNPFTSPARILQLLRRLNNWFLNNDLPLRIDFAKSEFQLTSVEAISVLIIRGKERTAKKATFSEMKDHFRRKKFTVNEICEALGISKATAERLLRKAFSDGLLCKERMPRGVAYRFTANKQMPRAA